jgi:GTP-binding protein Era
MIKFICGRVSIIGRPNTGKSTLLNRLVGEKISIVTPKPQTTRNMITGVLTKGPVQIIFWDTPGLYKPDSKLGDMMVKTIYGAVESTDCAILVAAADKQPGVPEKILIDRLKEAGIPCVLALNKIDLIKKDIILGTIAKYSALADFRAIIPISAKTGEGCGELLDEVSNILPESEHIFPEDMFTDSPERFICAEFVREKLMLELEQEIPHGIACETERFFEREDGIIEIDVLIVCEKDSHKRIIIGKHGSLLKKAGSEARAEIEKLLGAKVFLQLWVKVKSDWKNSVSFLGELGITGWED